MDGQFEPLRGNLAELSILLNTASNDEHVPEIERQIRTVKERTRAIYCTLPFNKMPRRLIIEMVYAANYWLNMFPRKGGISKTLSPRALLTGQSWSYMTHCKLEFGDYVQTHEEHDNSMAAWIIGAIAFRPTGNAQGGYFFFSLTTGHVLNRGRWTSLPMPNEVIDRVHRMACQEHGNNGLNFEDRNHNPLVDPDDDGDDNSTYHPEDDDNSDDDDNNNDEDGDDDDPGPPPVPDEAHPIYDNPPENLEGNVDPLNQDNQGNDPNANLNPINHDNQAEMDNNEDEDLPPNDQDEEYSTNSMTEQTPNNHEDPEVSNDGDSGTLLMPTDPTLPPQAQRELKRLATDGIGPTIYQGRTRSQTRQPEHNMLIQFPPEMDENWVRYGLAKLGQISELPNWQRMLFCAYTTQLLHSTGEVCWNNKDSYFIWFEFVCRNSGQIASRRSWKRSCLGLEYTSKCSRLALLWEPN